jgi:hypothetical protein
MKIRAAQVKTDVRRALLSKGPDRSATRALKSSARAEDHRRRLEPSGARACTNHEPKPSVGKTKIRGSTRLCTHEDPATGIGIPG